MNALATKLTRLSNDFLMTILTMAVIISLILVAIGSYNTTKISNGFQQGITTDFHLQALSGKISHYDEVLTMSARMAASTGNLSWQTRYEAYEPLLIEAIDNAIELAPNAYLPYAAQINTANLKLIDLENQAFSLVEKNQSQSALSLLFSDAYKAQKEAYGNGLQQWAKVLNSEINTNLTEYGQGLSMSSTFSMVSFGVLTVAWIVLLKLTNQYVQRRIIAEKKLRQAKAQLEMSHQELQVSEAALHNKAIALESALLELQQTQVQIIQSEKMSSLGQLVAGIAHEINNPVNFIHANLDPINEYTHDVLSLLSSYQTAYPSATPEIAEQAEATDIAFIQTDMPKIIQSMKVGTSRIREIVLSLRNFSRSDEQGLKTVDIHEGIESTLLILQHRLKDNTEHPPIHIHREYDELPLVECYPSQINQVLLNLLANAIDAIEDSGPETAGTREQNSKKDQPKNTQGSIRLSTSTFQQQNEQWIRISIADTGLGIPRNIQPRIFDAFYTTKPVGKGTGMGLSISHTVIHKKHGGSLSYRTFEGKGTEFIIQIPVVAAAHVAPTDETHMPFDMQAAL
ncbi:MAG: sensor histidine kinase [Phormidesmis sp.]